MAIKEINVENGFTSDDAIAYVKRVISNSKKTCIYIIHGYGSSGKGGIIRQKVRSFLNAQVKNGKIKTMINGEDFNIFNQIKSDKYYVNMAVAWAISICLIKFYNETIEYLENNTFLDNWTYNKSVQKAIESYRITNEQKDKLRRMKK